jgi:hypothetical protein
MHAEKISASEVVERFGRRQWKIQESSAKTGLGLSEGIDWLCDNLDQ